MFSPRATPPISNLKAPGHRAGKSKPGASTGKKQVNYSSVMREYLVLSLRGAVNDLVGVNSLYKESVIFHGVKFHISVTGQVRVHLALTPHTSRACRGLHRPAGTLGSLKIQEEVEEEEVNKGRPQDLIVSCFHQGRIHVYLCFPHEFHCSRGFGVVPLLFCVFLKCFLDVTGVVSAPSPHPRVLPSTGHLTFISFCNALSLVLLYLNILEVILA